MSFFQRMYNKVRGIFGTSTSSVVNVDVDDGLILKSDEDDIVLRKYSDTYQYTKDLFGLKTIEESNRLFFYRSPHKHDSLDDNERVKTIAPFLNASLNEANTDQFLNVTTIHKKPYEFPTEPLVEDDESELTITNLYV